MPEPATIGALVAGTLAAGAAEAGKAALGTAAKDAYAALRAVAVRVLGPAVAMLEKKPESTDLAAGLAEAVDAAPEPDRAELRTLAEAMTAAVPAAARVAIDNRVTVIATHGGTAIGGHTVNVTLPGKALGDGFDEAVPPSPFFGQVTATMVNLQQAPIIDVALVVAIAESQGYLSPDKVRAIEEQVARTQADLERVRRENPDWAAEVNAAIEAFNASELAAARDAFAWIHALIAERRADLLAEEAQLRLEQARSKHAQPTLFHPFEASRAEPLLALAAELAVTNFNYWIECGRARVQLGRLADALNAFERGRRIASDANAGRDLSVALNDIGDVRAAQGELPGALAAFAESYDILRDLAARDPGNAGWARDVVVSYGKVAQADPVNAAVHWAEVVARLEDMASRGVLRPADSPLIDIARKHLAAARSTD